MTSCNIQKIQGSKGRLQDSLKCVWDAIIRLCSFFYCNIGVADEDALRGFNSKTRCYLTVVC
jgi:hypothetical protein